MARRVYTQRSDGDLIRVTNRTHIIRCCDCGLVHLLKFKAGAGKLFFRAWRDDRATAASRRSKRYDQKAT